MAKTIPEQSPKLSIPEIISYCKNDLGIKFNLMDEDTAAEFLEKHNFFFRLKQYADVCSSKSTSGKYINLDFGHLVELSTIDMFLRKHILKMSIDFEHYLKVKLVNDCQSNPADDGYEVVQAFFKAKPKIEKSFNEQIYLAGYRSPDIKRYMESPSVWTIVETLSFFEFISFYDFYYSFFKIENEYTKHFNSVRRLRNVCAHNGNMLSLLKVQPNQKLDLEISFELLCANLGIQKGDITSSLKVPLLNDFAVMLSLYSRIISSPKIKSETYREVKEFFDGRMILRKEYFSEMSEIKNAYNFARKVLEYYSDR